MLITHYSFSMNLEIAKEQCCGLAMSIAPDRVYYRLTEKGKEAPDEYWSNPPFTLYPEIGPSHMKKPD